TGSPFSIRGNSNCSHRVGTSPRCDCTRHQEARRIDFKAVINSLEQTSDRIGELAKLSRAESIVARWTVIDEICNGAPYLKESHLSRTAKEKSTDASVSALSETVADLSREIAKTVIAIDR